MGPPSNNQIMKLQKLSRAIVMVDDDDDDERGGCHFATIPEVKL